jgi:16S rRNA (adenine1518-N6/adenine1519-N6)-dimethyltransferase
METGSSAPKKSLGQHWLKDVGALDAIANSARVNDEDTVLEIGPGLGTLTQVLIRRAKKVVAIEYDPELLTQLKGIYSSLPRYNDKLDLVHADILEFNLETLPRGYKVVANIPYYLTSKLLRVLCEAGNPFSQAALLVQKEVAERVAAKPGDMSLLSVSVQFYAEASLGVVVEAGKFTPTPKVDSQVLVLKHHGSLYKDVDTKRFFRLVKAGFSERRKKLRSSLSGGLHISKENVEAMLVEAGIAPDARAQELALDDWYALYQVTDNT